MKLSDYIAQFLAEHDMRHAFVVSGGAIIHSIDSVAKRQDMSYVCVAHEQAAGAAADAYWRTSRNIGVVMVTSGPGATNLTTSICNAYFDSIPVLIITGQVTTPRLRPSEKLRQKGFQETDVVSLFKSITNYVVQLRDPLQIKYEMQKAIHLATHGRPGPVVLDIPDDLQRTEIDVTQLKEFVPQSPVPSPQSLEVKVSKLFSLIQSAQRPVLIYGAGIRIADVHEEALEFARAFQIPVLLTWGGKDLMAHDDPLNFGGLGVVGPRAGNFAVQNADLVIAIGTRLSQMITGGKPNLFAPNAKKVIVDVDGQELSKFNQNEFALDLAIEADLKSFFSQVIPAQAGMTVFSAGRFAEWRSQIRQWVRDYPICPPEKYKRTDFVDGHVFIKELSNASREGDIFIGDTGANLSWTLQAIEMKPRQRIFSAWNHTPMGYALSASIGAASASRERVICLTGDGGLMMNIEELATIKRYDHNVKVLIFNNAGHAIQKQTIDTWLESRHVAVNERSGLGFPDFVKTAEAFGLKAFRIHNHKELKENLAEILNAPGPVVCDIMIDPDQKIEPMLKFGAGLEDLSPKLPLEEIKEIMRTSSTPGVEEVASIKTVSVIIPAFNEQGNIQAAIESVVAVVSAAGVDYEVIVVNDGSTDETLKRAQALAARNAHVRVISNASNQGFGFSFSRGVALAAMEYVTVFPGDNDMDAELLQRLVARIEAADIITSHPAHHHNRPFFRRCLSKSFVMLMNCLFDLRMRYYNGAFVARTQLLRSIPVKSTGLTALAECLVRLVKAGYSYESIAFEHTGRQSQKSKALRFKSIVAVVTLIATLWKDMHTPNHALPEKVCST